MKKLKHTPLVLFFLLGALSVVGCNKKEESSQQQAPVKVAENDPFNLEKTLARRIPSESVGFIYWDNTSEAYKKLAASQWGQSESVFLSLAKDPETERLLSFLKGAGINIDNPAELSQTIVEGAGFVTIKADAGGAQPSSVMPLSGGVVFRTGTAKSAKQLGESFKQQLLKEKLSAQPVTFTGGEGFSFVPSQVAAHLAPTDGQSEQASKDGTPAFVGWNTEFGVIASTKEGVEKVLAGAPAEIAPVLRSESAKKIAQKTIGESNRYATAFLDAESVLKNPAIKEKADAAVKDMPIQAVGIVSGFDSSPVSELRVIYQGQTESQKKFVQGIGAPVPPAVLSSLPSKPVLYLNLDGGFVKNIVELFSEGAPNPGTEIVNSIKSASIALRVAPMGQSMLPLPDAITLVESTKAEELFNEALSGLRAQGGNFNEGEKTIAGTSVKTFSSPMGFGVMLAKKGELIVATTTEAQMTEALNGMNGGKSAFAAVLPSRSKGLLLDGSTLTGFHINFVESATVAQSMSGMLQMFAPQAQGQEAFSPARLEEIKKLGQVSSSLRFEEDQFVFRGIYEPVNDQVAAN